MATAIVIGRFQVPKWHAGHLALWNFAIEKSGGVRPILGLGVARGITPSNPLGYAQREQIAEMSLGYTVTAFPILDEEDDVVWSKKLDELLYHMFPSGNYFLVSGRDGFHTRYHGRNKVEIFEGGPSVSGTSIRETVGKIPLSIDKAAGQIQGINLLAARYQMLAVDVAYVASRNVLLGRKLGESKWRLPGGKVDQGETLEQAAYRELVEETGIAASYLKYLRSYRVQDWRFKKEEEPVSALFYQAVTWHDQQVKASDDLEELRWQPLTTLDTYENEVFAGHRQMLRDLREEILGR